jgi:hypothetical protein
MVRVLSFLAQVGLTSTGGNGGVKLNTVLHG